MNGYYWYIKKNKINWGLLFIRGLPLVEIGLHFLTLLLISTVHCWYDFARLQSCYAVLQLRKT